MKSLTMKEILYAEPHVIKYIFSSPQYSILIHPPFWEKEESFNGVILIKLNCLC